MNQTETVTRYSLLDPDLPLLAVDAAYEIEDLISNTLINTELKSASYKLVSSTDLINRLKQIALSDQTVTADSELFCRSLMPQIEQDNISIPTEPISLSEKLNSVMENYKLKKSTDDLHSVRDFFIAVSDFSLNAQRWSRGSSNT